MRYNPEIRNFSAEGKAQLKIVLECFLIMVSILELSCVCVVVSCWFGLESLAAAFVMGLFLSDLVDCVKNIRECNK